MSVTSSTAPTHPAHGDVLDGRRILERARAAGVVLREEAAENERRRRLTERSVLALRRSGVFRMSMPRSWGGPEVDIATQIEVIEALAQADGSAGWCGSIGGGGGYMAAVLDDDVGRALFPDLDAVTAGWVMPAGRLDRRAGGFRLSGHWQFGSGCTHADVVFSGAVVHDGNAPALTAAGGPDTRLALVPADEIEVVDTWDTTGLAGSGSHDYTMSDVFVPREHTFRWSDAWREGALYAWPGLFAVSLLGVPLGIARAALDAAGEAIEDKVLVPEMRPARDEPRVRVGLARANALAGSARSYVFDVVGRFWQSLLAGSPPTRRQRAELAGCHLHTVRACRDAVEHLAEVLGSSSIRRSCPLERPRRDLATMSQHLTAQPRLLELTGPLWFDGAALDHALLEQRIF